MFFFFDNFLHLYRISLLNKTLSFQCYFNKKPMHQPLALFYDIACKYMQSILKNRCFLKQEVCLDLKMQIIIKRQNQDNLIFSCQSIFQKYSKRQGHIEQSLTGDIRFNYHSCIPEFLRVGNPKLCISLLTLRTVSLCFYFALEQISLRWKYQAFEIIR